MITDKITYKVLWVDDQEEIVESTKLDADEYGIELDHYSNWQDAEVALRNNFEDYTAIILDAYCKIKQSEDIKEEFIGAVLPSLASLCGEKNKYIPWYILSAGTMTYFNHTVKSAEYQHLTEEWGQMLYIKDAPANAPQNSHFLYENICRVGKTQASNAVLFRHKDVFAYLGKNKLIDERARKLMLKMLSALYLPEENIKFEYEGNPLRKVMEYIFRSAHKMGLLTDKCFVDKDKIVLLDASRYLAGLTINCRIGNKIICQARWGNPGKEKEGSGGNSVFPQDIAELVRNILNYSSSDSHTSEEQFYLIDEQKKELFFGYVMQLCHIIKWYGKYVEEHNNEEENKKNQKIIEIPEESNTTKYEGQKFTIKKDENDNYFCEECKIPNSAKNHVGKEAVLYDVTPNNDTSTKLKYPLYARFKII